MTKRDCDKERQRLRQRETVAKRDREKNIIVEKNMPEGTHTEQLSRLLMSISDKQTEVSHLKELLGQRVIEHVITRPIAQSLTQY